LVGSIVGRSYHDLSVLLGPLTQRVSQLHLYFVCFGVFLKTSSSLDGSLLKIILCCCFFFLLLDLFCFGFWFCSYFLNFFLNFNCISNFCFFSSREGCDFSLSTRGVGTLSSSRDYTSSSFKTFWREFTHFIVLCCFGDSDINFFVVFV